MAEGTVTLSVSLEMLIQAISTLSLEDKYKILEALDEQVSDIEDAFEQTPAIQAKIQEARTAYEARDYLTIQDFIAQTKEEE